MENVFKKKIAACAMMLSLLGAVAIPMGASSNVGGAIAWAADAGEVGTTVSVAAGTAMGSTAGYAALEGAKIGGVAGGPVGAVAGAVTGAL